MRLPDHDYIGTCAWQYSRLVREAAAVLYRRIGGGGWIAEERGLLEGEGRR